MKRGSAESRFSETLRLLLIGGIIGACRAYGRSVLSDRYFFITCRLLPPRRLLDEADCECHARVIAGRRTERGFVLTAWVFLPDHWHVILFPRHPLTISDAMKSIKLSSTNSLGKYRGEAGELWQGRFPALRSRASFDRALRTVKEYAETVEYIHRNPVRRGLVRHPGRMEVVELS